MLYKYNIPTTIKTHFEKFGLSPCSMKINNSTNSNPMVLNYILNKRENNGEYYFETKQLKNLPHSGATM